MLVHKSIYNYCKVNEQSVPDVVYALNTLFTPDMWLDLLKKYNKKE